LLLLGLAVALFAYLDGRAAVSPARRLVLGLGAGTVQALAFRPDGSLLVATRSSLATWFFHTDPDRGVVEMLEQGLPLGEVVVSAAGAAVCAGRDGSVVFWDPVGGARPAGIKPRYGRNLAVAFGREGLTVAASDEGSAVVRDAQGDDVSLRARIEAVGVLSVALAPDGRTLATGDAGGCVRLWHLATCRPLWSVRAHRGPVTTLAFDGGGRRLASASKTDVNARLWDTPTGRSLGTLGGHGLPVQCLSFSPVGGRLATASMDGTVHLWDVPSARRLSAFAGDGAPVTALAFSAHGERLAAGSPGEVLVWDLPDGSLRSGRL
jgi:WD40 repeat protein